MTNNTPLATPIGQAKDEYAYGNRMMPSVLLMGEIGSGKTSSLKELPKYGFKRIFIFALEPGIEDILGDTDSEVFHWKYIAPTAGTLSDLKEMFRIIRDTTNWDAIQAMNGIDKSKYTQSLELIAASENFICDRTKKSYGRIYDLTPDDVVVVDSLSGLTDICKGNAIGNKPFMSMRDYQPVQAQIEAVVKTFVGETKAFFVMTAHLEREPDPNTGISTFMVSTAGKALAPRLPRYFSDCIVLYKKEVNGRYEFFWSTMIQSGLTKGRNLGYIKEIPAADGFKRLLAGVKKGA